jgi:hypothetical protein
MKKKQPFVVHCDCGHEWTAAYLPMSVTDFAKLTGKILCPMCGGKEVFCGPAGKPYKSLAATLGFWPDFSCRQATAALP